jgi:NAD(P)-dependent dehydrogenase (short-subunit alcohol dehydrogenase family)
MSAAAANQKGSLRAKAAVVTGAARGIGRATAVAFAREGADVAGIDVCAAVYPASGVTPSTKDDLDESGRLVQSAGTRWLSLVADQRDTSGLRSAAAQIEKQFGGIDIVFANGGVQGFKPLLEMDDSDWQIQIDNNLTGTANVIRAFAPYLVKRKGGRIIVASSTQGRHGMKYGSAYSASKWEIIGLMKSAALELAPFGITVNALGINRHALDPARGTIRAGVAGSGTDTFGRCSGRREGKKNPASENAARRAVD